MKTFSGQTSVQVEMELEAFIALLKQYDVRRYLEIGVGHGDMFHRVMKSLPPGSCGVALDAPEQAWGLAGSRENLESAIADLSADYDVCAIFGNSRDAGIVRQVKALGPFDAVFIDGDHSYEGVKADYINYSNLAHIVGFHDIADPMRKNNRGERIRVPQFWMELEKDSATTKEFIAPGSTMGIGVLIGKIA